MTLLENIKLDPANSPADLIDLQESLLAIDVRGPEESMNPSGPWRVRWAFRGQSKPYGTLVPSFQRIFGPKRSVGAAEIIERDLIKTFRKHYASLQGKSSDMPVPDVIDERYTLRCLSVMQHYGVPTRLLDWTSDFWTAVYFACAGDPAEQGELWFYDRDIFLEQVLRDRVDLASLQHWLYDGSAFFNQGRTRPDIQQQVYASSYRPPDYGSSVAAPPAEPELLSLRGANLIVELDPQITPRMRQQSAHHTVSSDVFADHAPLLFDMAQGGDLKTHTTGYFHRILIAPGCKERTLRFLEEQRHVTAGTIFPDVEGLGKFLHWHLESLVTTLL